jgi:hypothetical protein
VLIGAVYLVGVLGVIVAAGELLRHPHRSVDVPADQLAVSDPRDEVICDVPIPREGQRRAPVSAPGSVTEVTSTALYDCPQFYDGWRVRYRGEVVGGLLHRDIGVWTQLNDDVYAELVGPLPTHRVYRGLNSGVGVLLPPDVAGNISFVGGPKNRGDVLQVEGTFHRVDATGEVAIIRADAARIVSAGRPYSDPPQTARRIAASLVTLVAGAIVVAERVVARQR